MVVVTMAYDERFAIGLIGSSGQRGVSLDGRNDLNYAGSKTAEDLPVDAHELVTLCAPRPVFISVGSLKVEGTWIDAKGSFLAGLEAGPVYKLLGKKDYGTRDFPDEKVGLTDGEVAFRMHEGGHTVGPNWPTFLTWADRYLKVKK